MKYWGIVVYVIISFQLNHAQYKIYVGADFSPSLSNISVSEETKAGLTYSTGIDGLYFLDEHLFIKTGINFSQRSFIAINIPNTIGPFFETGGIIDLRNEIDLDEIPTFDITAVFQSVNLLLNLNYKFAGEHKTSFVFSAGLELGYFYKTNYVWDFPNGKQIITNLKYKELMGEFNIGLGLYQPISKKFLLQIIPKYSYSVYDDRSPGIRELYSIKLDMEFYFQLI